MDTDCVHVNLIKQFVSRANSKLNITRCFQSFYLQRVPKVNIQLTNYTFVHVRKYYDPMKDALPVKAKRKKGFGFWSSVGLKIGAVTCFLRFFCQQGNT